MTASTQNYTRMMQEMMSSFPMDMTVFQDGFKSCATFGQKMSRVALEAAEKSTDISAKWTRETITKLNDATAVRDEPSDYGRAMTGFASAQVETTAETIAAFAEVAKKVQMEAVELMLTAGKEMSGDTATAGKASGGATKKTAAAR